VLLGRRVGGVTRLHVGGRHPVVGWLIESLCVHVRMAPLLLAISSRGEAEVAGWVCFTAVVGDGSATGCETFAKQVGSGVAKYALDGTAMLATHVCPDLQKLTEHTIRAPQRTTPSVPLDLHTVLATPTMHSPESAPPQPTPRTLRHRRIGMYCAQASRAVALAAGAASVRQHAHRRARDGGRGGGGGGPTQAQPAAPGGPAPRAEQHQAPGRHVAHAGLRARRHAAALPPRGRRRDVSLPGPRAALQPRLLAGGARPLPAACSAAAMFGACACASGHAHARGCVEK
jgi:hypothetical protein